MMEEEKEGKERRDDIMWSVAVCPAVSTYVCDATLDDSSWDVRGLTKEEAGIKW